MACHYCGTDEETRPYGPGGSPVCFDCATATPERSAETGRNFEAQAQAAFAMSPVNGIVINGDGPPEPLMPGDLEAL